MLSETCLPQPFSATMSNEPFVAVNPINPNDIVMSSFSFGAPRNPDAALFYSTNGGTT
jgi:hypothetical protein